MNHVYLTYINKNKKLNDSLYILTSNLFTQSMAVSVGSISFLMLP